MPDKGSRTPEDLKNTIVRLENRLKLYEAVFEQLDVGLHVIDAEKNTILYNKAMGQFENEDPADILNRPFLDVLSHFSLHEEHSTLLRVLRSGETLPNLKQTYINSNGRTVTTINSNQPVFIDGVMVAALEIAKDVTYIEALADKMLELREHLSKNGKKNAKSGQAPQASPGVRYSFKDILGSSPAMFELLHQARRVAETSSNVLICGETGTGKELLAQSIHAASKRADRPFIDINCAALPSQLLEGLLFGSVKGSFTDAQDRAGFFEQAHRGTLLLDEVNSMHPDLQSKLLRVLQEKRLRRLGGDTNVEVDVRIIATMNKSPKEAIEQKELREDLYYRLSVAGLHIPPLRERPEDIPVYCEYFLLKYAKEMHRSIHAMSPEVEAIFRRHSWPGNVRQLEHVIEGALNIAGSEEKILRTGHLSMLFQPRPLLTAEAPRVSVSLSPESDETSLPDLKRGRMQMERRSIQRVLATFEGNITKAAARMGITRQLLQYKIKKYGLQLPPPPPIGSRE